MINKQIKPWIHILLSIVIGIIVGVLTILGQGVLPVNWNWLVNSGTVWLIPPFFIAALAPTKLKAAISGVITLLSPNRILWLCYLNKEHS